MNQIMDPSWLVTYNADDIKVIQDNNSIEIKFLGKITLYNLYKHPNDPRAILRVQNQNKILELQQLYRSIIQNRINNIKQKKRVQAQAIRLQEQKKAKQEEDKKKLLQNRANLFKIAPNESENLNKEMPQDARILAEQNNGQIQQNKGQMQQTFGTNNQGNFNPRNQSELKKTTSNFTDLHQTRPNIFDGQGKNQPVRNPNPFSNNSDSRSYSQVNAPYRQNSNYSSYGAPNNNSSSSQPNNYNYQSTSYTYQGNNYSKSQISQPLRQRGSDNIFGGQQNKPFTLAANNNSVNLFSHNVAPQQQSIFGDQQQNHQSRSSRNNSRAATRRNNKDRV